MSKYNSTTLLSLAFYFYRSLLVPPKIEAKNVIREGVRY